MSMTTQFGFADPERVSCTLAITMPLHEWKALRDTLDANTSDNIYYLKAAIANVIDQAKKQFVAYSTNTSKGEPK